MPNPVHVTKAADLQTSGGQTEGMIRKVTAPLRQDSIPSQNVRQDSFFRYEV
jgi:hypothetical protein